MEADGDAGGEAGRQLEDAAFAGGTGEVAAGEGGDGGFPVDGGHWGAVPVPCLMNRLVKSSRLPTVAAFGIDPAKQLCVTGVWDVVVEVRAAGEVPWICRSGGLVERGLLLDSENTLWPLKRVASDNQGACGPESHNCAGQMDDLGIEHN